MTKKRRSPKTLSLKKRAVRELSSRDAQQAQGGRPMGTDDCTMYCADPAPVESDDCGGRTPLITTKRLGNTQGCTADYSGLC